MASVSLGIIVPRYSLKLDAKLAVFAPYFDKIYIQENQAGVTVKPSFGNAEKSFFTWNDNFADARNALLQNVKTDYWCWLDEDDDIAGIKDNLKEVIEHMESSSVDIMMAPYIYQVDDSGQPTEVQNRERIIRTSVRGKWYGAIHETFIPDQEATSEHTDKLQWIHQKTKGGHQESMARNRRVLEREYRKEPRDPRIAYYLGLNYGMDGRYREAIRCFEELIQTGGWNEERYRAHLQIFSCYFELREYPRAVDAALRATAELPSYPDAYFMLQQVYYQLDQHEKSLEWFRVGKSKPLPQSDSAFNPVVRGPQPLYLAATSYLFLGKPQPAMNHFLELSRNYPSYPIPESVKQVALDAVNEERAIESVKYLIDFNQKYEGDSAAVLDSLPPAVRSDVRLTKERRELIPGKKWPKNSIAIYCGPSFEAWGPDTLDQGMGGSEEAVVYLSRELAKAGHDVTIFNERTEPYAEALGGSVTENLETGEQDNALVGNRYKPWTEINPNDTFDIYIAWRSPQGLENIKARKKILDLHDILPPEDIYKAEAYTDIFAFKSQFHRNLYPELPDSKCVIIGNGINKKEFA